MFFNHTDQNYDKLSVIPKHLKTQQFYRIHNTIMKGHLGIQKTVNEVRRNPFFPGFNEFVIAYNNNCLKCAQKNLLDTNIYHHY